MWRLKGKNSEKIELEGWKLERKAVRYKDEDRTIKIVHIRTTMTKDHKIGSNSTETDVYCIKYIILKIRGTEWREVSSRWALVLGRRDPSSKAGCGQDELSWPSGAAAGVPAHPAFGGPMSSANLSLPFSLSFFFSMLSSAFYQSKSSWTLPAVSMPLLVLWPSQLGHHPGEERTEPTEPLLVEATLSPSRLR